MGSSLSPIAYRAKQAILGVFAISSGGKVWNYTISISSILHATLSKKPHNIRILIR